MIRLHSSTTMLKKVYISGPFTNGSEITNLRNAIDAGNKLFELGFLPFIPHSMTFLWELLHEHSYDKWLSFDLEWIKSCDMVLRLPGESKGADIECEAALKLNIPVYTDINKLMATESSRSIEGQS